MIARYETEHYVFHYLEGSLAARDIEEIAATQERCYRKICGMLKTDYPRKISYWLYESPDVVGGNFWDGEPCNGLAFDTDDSESIGKTVSLSGKEEDRFTVEPYSIHAVYEERIKCTGEHEDTHVIAAHICPEPKSMFLIEGLAMHMDGRWWGRDNRIWAQEYLKSGELLDTAKLIGMDEDGFYDLECAKTYPVGGAYTEFIADRYGMEKFMKLYCSEDPAGDAAEIFGRMLPELHEEFKEWLS
ncbi:MAG: hypothetical protein J6S78_08565 [Lachnospiraceae bacterium]|nr:hypothetical protein [Lachnospiraceae bacterium]